MLRQPIKTGLPSRRTQMTVINPSAVIVAIKTELAMVAEIAIEIASDGTVAVIDLAERPMVIKN